MHIASKNTIETCNRNEIIRQVLKVYKSMTQCNLLEQNFVLEDMYYCV